MADLHDFRDSFNVRGSPPRLDVGLGENRDEVVDTTGVYLPNPLRFDNEGFNAFAVKDGRIYRLKYDASSRNIKHSFDETNTTKPVVYVSSLDRPNIYTDVINFDDGLTIEEDYGICLTEQYLYVNVIGRQGAASRDQHLYQIRLVDHRVKKMFLPGLYHRADNFRGMVIDLDNKRKPYLLGNFTRFTGVSGVLGWSEIRGARIWELDEETLIIRPVLSAGNGFIRLVTHILTDKSVPLSARDEQRTYHGEVGYVLNGLLWNTCQIQRRIIEIGTPPNTIKWAGLATWRWSDIEQYKLIASEDNFWVDMTIGVGQFPGVPSLDLLDDIGMSPPLSFTNEYQRIWSFCVDDQKVGWISYFRTNNEAPDNNPNLPFNDTTSMYTHLYRYNLSEVKSAPTEEEIVEDVEPVVPLEFTWSEPNSYSFSYQLPETFATTRHTLGTVRCSVNSDLDGSYKIVSVGLRYTGVSPYSINTATGELYVQPVSSRLLLPGPDSLRVAYELSDGTSSTIDVEVVVYARPSTLTPTTNVAARPIWFNEPYDYNITEGRSVRTQVAHVFALRATSYRFHSSVSTTDWEINSSTGQIYWKGASAIEDAPHIYDLRVQAVNSGLSGQTESVAETVVSVISVEVARYVPPRLNHLWIPEGWSYITWFYNGRRTIDQESSLAFYNTQTVDMANGVIEGSVSRNNWKWKLKLRPGDTQHLYPVYTEHSSKFAFVGVYGFLADSYDVAIDDGVQETDVALFRPNFIVRGAPPETNYSFINFYQGNNTTATTSINISVQENSSVTEILTAESDRLYVLTTPQSGYRSANVLVESGSDKISVALGDISDRSIGGTINKVRRVHVYTSGAALDFEDDTSETAVVSATALAWVSDTDVGYRAAQQKLTFNITVTDSVSETSPDVYYAPVANFGWIPGDGWSRTEAQRWERDEDVGQSGAFEIDVSDAVISGSAPHLSWIIESSDDSIGQAIVYNNMLITKGVAAGDVSYQISVSDRTVTTFVAQLDVTYSEPTTESNSTVVFYRDGAELTEIDFEIVDSDAETELEGSDVYVSVEEIENRIVNIESSESSVVRAVLADDTEEITVGSDTKDVKQLQIYHNALAQTPGDVDGTITAQVYQTTIGSTTYSAASADLTVDGEVDYKHFEPEIELWRKHHETGVTEQITNITGVVALKGTDSGSHFFPDDDDHGRLGDYDYYIYDSGHNVALDTTFPNTAIVPHSQFLGVYTLGGVVKREPRKLRFQFNVDDNTSIFTTPNMVAQTGTLQTYIGDSPTANQTTPVREPSINSNSGTVVIDHTSTNFTVSGEVQVLSNIKLYNGNVRTQQTSLVMADANAFSIDQIFPEIGGASYVTHTLIPVSGGPLKVEFQRYTNDFVVSLSRSTTQVQVLREGGGTETLRMKTLVVRPKDTTFPQTYSNVLRLYVDERSSDAATYREGELLVPISGELTETYEAPTLDTTFVPTSSCELAALTNIWTRENNVISAVYDLAPEPHRFAWLPADLEDVFDVGSRPYNVITKRISYDDTTRYIAMWYQERSRIVSFVPTWGWDEDGNTLDNISGDFNIVINDRQTTLTQPINISASGGYVPSFDIDREIGLRQSISATEITSISSVTVDVDRQMHVEEILTSDTEALYVYGEPSSSLGRRSDIEVIVAEGAHMITARMGDIETKTNNGVEESVQRLRLYASGADMPATQTSAKILVALLGRGSTQPKVLEFDVTINPSGNKAPHPVYVAPYYNMGFHPCRMYIQTSGTIVSLHDDEFRLRRLDRTWDLRIEVGGEDGILVGDGTVTLLLTDDNGPNDLFYGGYGASGLDVDVQAFDAFNRESTEAVGDVDIEATISYSYGIGLRMTIPEETARGNYVLTVSDELGTPTFVATKISVNWRINE